MQPTPIATTTITTTKTSDLPPVGALIPSVFWRRNRVSNIQRRDSIGIHVYMTLFGHHCLIWSYIKPLLPSLSQFDSLHRVRRPVFDNALDLTRVYSQMLLIHFCTSLLRPV